MSDDVVIVGVMTAYLGPRADGPCSRSRSTLLTCDRRDWSNGGWVPGIVRLCRPWAGSLVHGMVGSAACVGAGEKEKKEKAKEKTKQMVRGSSPRRRHSRKAMNTSEDTSKAMNTMNTSEDTPKS